MRSGTLLKLLAGHDLSPREVRSVFQALMDIETTDAERAAWLVALRAKGESLAEVRGFAAALRERAVPFPGARRAGAVDLCGCGGARRPTFNVSTVSAFVVRAAGAPVVKHGNRSARGHTGSTDILEALGLPVANSRAFARESFRRLGLAFLHAPLFHPATRAVQNARRALRIPSIFNLLGPLTNPAGVPFQVVGCPDPGVASLVAEVLPSLGVRRGIAFTGEEGTDEFSPRRWTTLLGWGEGKRFRRRIAAREYLEPEDRRGPWNDLPAAEAAQEAERILAGGGGARRGSVLLTSAAALWVTGRVGSLREGVASAAEALDSGRAEEMLRGMQSLAREREWPEES